jgi:hypothetical protein
MTMQITPAMSCVHRSRAIDGLDVALAISSSLVTPC